MPPATSRRSPGSAPVLVLTAAALWGTTGTAQALGDVDDPVAVGAARLAAGGVVLVLLAVVAGGRGPLSSCLRPPLLGWTLLAAVATAGYQSAFFTAVATTGVATGTVVALGTAPVATGLFGAVLLGERLTARWAGATALAVGGCLVLVTAGSGTASARPVGVGLAGLAGAGYGLYTVAAKALLEREVPVVAAMAVTLGLGAVLLAPVLLLPVLRGDAGPPAGRTVLLVVWLGLATTAVAYLLFAHGLRRLPAATVGTLSLAEPLTAAALGLLVLGERPTPRAVLGGAVLLTGLLLAALRPVTEPPPTAAAPPREVAA